MGRIHPTQGSLYHRPMSEVQMESYDAKRPIWFNRRASTRRILWKGSVRGHRRREKRKSSKVQVIKRGSLYLYSRRANCPNRSQVEEAYSDKGHDAPGGPSSDDERDTAGEPEGRTHPWCLVPSPPTHQYQKQISGAGSLFFPWVSCVPS